MTTILLLLLAVLAAACLVWVAYSKFREEELTREKYATRCLGATVSLVSLAVAAISSKQGPMDHVMKVASLITGQPAPPAEPISMSEQMMIVMLVAFATVLIFKSHSNWNGLVSADEVNRRRLQRPINLIPQALDESARLLRGAPEREIYQSASRLKGEVPEPAAPPLVWHEYARELFELWFGNSRFERSDSAWDGQMQSWSGRHTKLDQPLFLFCRQQEPSAPDLAAIALYVNELAAGRKVHVYIVHRGQIAKQDDLEYPQRITCLSESFLLDHLVDFADYYYAISRRVSTDCFPNSNNTLTDIYVPSCLMDLNGTPISNDLGQTVEAWAQSPPRTPASNPGRLWSGKKHGCLDVCTRDHQHPLLEDRRSYPNPPRVAGKEPREPSAGRVARQLVPTTQDPRTGVDDATDRRPIDPDLRGVRRNG
jgi:hypothetical protein